MEITYQEPNKTGHYTMVLPDTATQQEIDAAFDVLVRDAHGIPANADKEDYIRQQARKHGRQGGS